MAELRKGKKHIFKPGEKEMIVGSGVKHDVRY
jgi:hypothetical protein